MVVFVEPAVRDAMARANGRHNLRVLERAIDLYNHGSAGTKSSHEDAFLKLETGLPEPLSTTSSTATRSTSIGRSESSRSRSMPTATAAYRAPRGCRQGR